MLRDWPGRFAIGSYFEAVFAAIGLALELVLRFVAWLFRPAIGAIRTALGGYYPKTAPAEPQPREMPPGMADGIEAALRAGTDAAAALPHGWRGFHIANSSDSERIGDLPVGAAVRLVLEPDNDEREDAVRAEAVLSDRSMVTIGHLRRGHELGRSIAHGRVRCWFADRRRTLRATGWEAVLFVAVYDP
jgi:hypothetical protein